MKLLFLNGIESKGAKPRARSHDLIADLWIKVTDLSANGMFYGTFSPNNFQTLQVFKLRACRLCNLQYGKLKMHMIKVALQYTEQVTILRYRIYSNKRWVSNKRRTRKCGTH